MKRTPLPPRKNPLKRSAIKRVPKGATTIERMLGEGLISKASTFKSVPKPIRKRRPRKDGMTQPKLFRQIWKSRPHNCEVCGDPIQGATLTNFSHLLGKGAYPSMKYDERNVELWCELCHRLWTDKEIDKDDRQGAGIRWARVNWKAVGLRAIANGVSSE